jgi:hypothetical protein
MALIDNVSTAHKLFSVRISSLGAILAGVWVALPAATQTAAISAVGLSGAGGVVALAFLANLAARLIKQGEPATA